MIRESVVEIFRRDLLKRAFIAACLIPSAAALGGVLPQRMLEIRRPDGRNIAVWQDNTTLSYVNTHGRTVALTFDDGPHAQWTPGLLKLLEKLGVPATFFVVGEKVDQHPELVRLEHAEGFEVENHSYTHPNMTSLTPLEMGSEIRR